MLCYSLRETTPKSTEDVEEREGTSSVESQSRSGFASDQRGPLDRRAMKKPVRKMLRIGIQWPQVPFLLSWRPNAIQMYM